MKSAIRLTKLLILTTAIGGCAQTVDSYCLKAWPITYSAAQDSEQTKTEIKQHNAVYKTSCK